MSTPTSNIRVFVQWSEQTVFAGEDVECQITFKNISTASGSFRKSTTSNSNAFSSSGERQRRTSILQSTAVYSRTANNQSPRPALIDHGHRPSLSLNVASGDKVLRRGSPSGSGVASDTRAATQVHRRSLSIMSMGMIDSGLDDMTGQGGFGESAQKTIRGHEQLLNHVPRRTSASGNGGSQLSDLSLSSSSHQPRTQQDLFSSGALDITAEPITPEERSEQSSRINTAPGTPGLAQSHSAKPNIRVPFAQEFMFPNRSFESPDEQSASTTRRDPVDIPREDVQNDTHVDPHKPQDFGSATALKPKDGTPLILGHATQSAKTLSPMTTETPRSSGEFYSLSNNSTETLASEYVPQHSSRIVPRATHARKISNLTPMTHRNPPEILMMGYAQVYGSFSLDGSLVNQGPFDEVKRKGVFGGQGGGVIGIETGKGQSGLFRSLGWGTIGESLGGLLGGGELSSIKDMRGIASSKSVPLLSTPQSILFVDLKLASGESRTFKYAFKLPKGLPPTHRGKAIKISYNLVIGTQRPGGAREQQINSVNVPFRVLGSVNEYGELLGHDLMSPYIVLRDTARVQSLSAPISESRSELLRLKSVAKNEPAQSSLEDFLAYVDELLTKPRQNSSMGLLSPTATTLSRRQSSFSMAVSAKEAIDLAILRSNLATESQQSANRFEIARNGQRVAVVMLARPAYRMGETVTAVIDFTDADISCYALHASLETAESVDPAIALRSEASIHRVTRRIHSSHSESALFARRIVFSATIPATATPTFITSGVSLDWKILIEFVTPRVEGPTLGGAKSGVSLLEEISRDERGIVLAAAETVDCESFEIAVPLRVYGAVAGTGDRNETPPGLVV